VVSERIVLNALDEGNGANGLPEGHLHDGGSKMYLFINDKPVCATSANYGRIGSGRESIVGMTPCKVPLQVKGGDWLSMVAEYDLKKYSQ
jgi:hypothetical protein